MDALQNTAAQALADWCPTPELAMALSQLKRGWLSKLGDKSMFGMKWKWGSFWILTLHCHCHRHVSRSQPPTAVHATDKCQL